MKVEYQLKTPEESKRISIGGIDISNLLTVTIEGQKDVVEKVVATLEKDWALS